MGMTPRCEVGIVVAQIGLSPAVINDSLCAVVLFMAVATRLIAPPFLKWLFAIEKAANDKVDSDDAGGIVSQGDFCKIG